MTASQIPVEPSRVHRARRRLRTAAGRHRRARPRRRRCPTPSPSALRPACAGARCGAVAAAKQSPPHCGGGVRRRRAAAGARGDRPTQADRAAAAAAGAGAAGHGLRADPQRRDADGAARLRRVRLRIVDRRRRAPPRCSPRTPAAGACGPSRDGSSVPRSGAVGAGDWSRCRSANVEAGAGKHRKRRTSHQRARRRDLRAASPTPGRHSSFDGSGTVNHATQESMPLVLEPVLDEDSGSTGDAVPALHDHQHGHRVRAGPPHRLADDDAGRLGRRPHLALRARPRPRAARWCARPGTSRGTSRRRC